MSETFRLSAEPMQPSKMIGLLESGSSELDRYLGEEIYANSNRKYLAAQRERFAHTVRLHAERVGDKPTVLLRAPGRLNAFLEYLDMCDGDHMSTTIDGDIPLAVSARDDGILSVANANQLFRAADLSIRDELERFAGAPWDKYAQDLDDNWDNRSLVYPHFGRPQGDWLNYVLSPYLRVSWDDPKLQVRGADLTFGPATAPFRAGTSSSSAIVVLSFLALCLSNRETLAEWRIQEICKLLGEAEWYVGTHGGANDQTTILRNPCNSVLYNRHSQADLDSTSLPFLKGVHVVLANSLWEVNKTLGGNQSFNMRKGWMEMGDEIMKLIVACVREAHREGRPTSQGWLANLIHTQFGFTTGDSLRLLESDPGLWDKIGRNYRKFGSLSEDILEIPGEAIEELITLLPVKITPAEAGRILGKDADTIERIYTKPRRDIGGFHLRTTARFFHKENIIGRTLERIFLEAQQRVVSGDLSPYSPQYDDYRVRVGRLVDDLQDTLIFDFRVSNPQLDLLLAVARRGPGYLGGKLTGAGKGGCASILVREADSEAMCRHLDQEYYGKPEHFEVYRQVLEDDCRFSRPDTPEHSSAQERLQNLEAALLSIGDQRRVVTFSRGACALTLKEEAPVHPRQGSILSAS